jgi:D-alanine-D-alanine ligase
MRVALTCNTVPKSYSQENGDDTFAEFDSPATVDAIKNALLNHCSEVEVIEADENAYQKLKEGHFDFAFNIAEGIRGDARESQIPAMLEMLGIPYAGSGVSTLAITLDKRRTKEVLLANGIRTPRFQLFDGVMNPKTNLEFPLFIKPNNEGSSRGITSKSLVRNKEELETVIFDIIRQYNQLAIAEEYLDGREFTAGVIGNSKPFVLPIVEVDFDSLPEDSPKFDCYEVKWIYDSPCSGYETTKCPADLTDDLRLRIENTAVDTCKALDIKDFCRIDMRLDKEGEPSVIDVNALPGLNPDPIENSRFPKAAYAAGFTYDELIGAVFEAALKRTRMMS